MISDLDVTNRLSISGIYELPFGKGTSLTHQLFGGWQVQGVYTYQTGFPVPFANDAFYQGDKVAIDGQSTDRWFNTGAFTSILTATSNASTPVNHKRSYPFRFSDVRRDPINNTDLSVIKNVKFQSGMGLQLRLEYINVLDQPYFPQPVANPTSSTFGQIVASNQSNYARRAQVGIKLTF
jgi:hypothetical protein